LHSTNLKNSYLKVYSTFVFYEKGQAQSLASQEIQLLDSQSMISPKKVFAASLQKVYSWVYPSKFSNPHHLAVVIIHLPYTLILPF
jgi:hypothetical protein